MSASPSKPRATDLAPSGAGTVPTKPGSPGESKKRKSEFLGEDTPPKKRKTSPRTTPEKGSNSKKKKPWLLYYKGPETQSSHHERKKWSSDYHQWKKDEILKQFFIEYKDNESCVFGCHLEGNLRFWFGVHLTFISTLEKQMAVHKAPSVIARTKPCWRIAENVYSSGVTPEQAKALLEEKNTEFKAPSSFWGDSHKEFQAKMKSVDIKVSDSRTGFEEIKTIKNIIIQVPEYMQREPFNANPVWNIPQGTSLATAVSLGILNKLVKSKNARSEVLDAIKCLNAQQFELKPTKPASHQHFNFETVTKQRSQDEKIAQKKLCRQLKEKGVEVKKEEEVIFPSQNYGFTDLLITSPHKIIVELKVAKNWPDAVGQIKRYQQSKRKETNETLKNYKLVIFMVNCFQRGEECVYLKEARDTWPDEHGFHFTCQHKQIDTWLKN